MRRLGELENAVMDRLWARNQPATVRDVLDDLCQERQLAYTTVMTVMDKLYRKGFLRRALDGRAYRYEPVYTREAYTAELMHDAWAFSGSQAVALVHFLERMSPEQRGALQDALRVVTQQPERAD